MSKHLLLSLFTFCTILHAETASHTRTPCDSVVA